MSHILYMDVSFFVFIFRAIRPNLLSILIYHCYGRCLQTVIYKVLSYL